MLKKEITKAVNAAEERRIDSFHGSYNKITGFR